MTPVSEAVEETSGVGLRPGVAALVEGYPALAAVVDEHGAPPAWEREPGFGVLVLFILEQQISLDAARAHFDRLAEACGGAVAPERVVALDDETMLAAGVSRQKRRYLRVLSEMLLDGRLDLDAVATATDAEARRMLTSVTGIGAWTADCYLMFCLRRPDVWPVGDIALQQAAAEVLDRPTRLTQAELAEVGERWRPHRSEAARILWHQYLTTRGRS